MIERLAKLFRSLSDNSLLLVIGAAAGLIWANLAPDSYENFRQFPLDVAPWFPFYDMLSDHGISILAVVNDVLMAFFFAAAGKEVWAAMLPGGALRNPRHAATPVICAIGGMIGPALLYLLGAGLLGQLTHLGRGWAIPCATDIAFSYMIALVVFGKGHPATAFLLLLAIADDALGLIVLAAFYPTKPVHPLFLLLSVAAVLLAFLLRRFRLRSFWWYILPCGTMSWLGFHLAGLHPALGLLPIIPALPHAHLGQAAVHWGISPGNWALDKFETWWQRPVDVFLGIFGLVNAGVPLRTEAVRPGWSLRDCSWASQLAFLAAALSPRRFCGWPCRQASTGAYSW